MVLGPRNFSLAPSVVFKPKKSPPKKSKKHEHRYHEEAHLGNKIYKKRDKAKSQLKTNESVESSKGKLGEWQSIEVVTDIGGNNS